MPALEFVAVLNTFLNVMIGLWLLPSTIQLDSRGRLKSVAFVRFTTYTVLLISLNSLAVLQNAAWSIDPLIKIVLMSLLPIVSAYLMQRFYFARLS